MKRRGEGGRGGGGGEGGRGFTEKRDRERQRSVSAAGGEYMLMLNEFGHSDAQ